jgi:type IV pilus assembly protein PilV
MTINIKNQSGIGLIEVLIAVLILGTALLTLTSLQTRSLQFNQGAYLRSQANILAYDILDRIRINRDKAVDYDLTMASLAPTGTTTLRDRDVADWLNAVEALLPNGDGSIDCDSDNKCTINITWTEQLSSASNENETLTFTYSSHI